VDLSGLQSIDTAALRELVGTCRVIHGMDEVLALVHRQPDVERTLRLSGVDQMMPVHDSVEEAMAGQAQCR
jgi:anti-anti-sigma factor